MWKYYAFRKENAEKINNKFSGKYKSENVLIESLYRSFAENTKNDSVYDNAKDILSFVSLSSSENLKKEQMVISEVTVDDVKPIPVEIECQVNELKDILKCVQSNNFETDVIIKLLGIIFSNVNLLQVTTILDYLELHTLNEVTFYSNFCQLLLQITPPVGFSVGLCLVQQLLYSQVVNLKAPASRLLISTILDWTKAFPKVILEGIITSCIQDNHLICVDFINICNINRKCLQVLNTVEERHFIILQTLIEKKVNFEECWDILLAKLVSASEEQRKSISFTKLLLTLLTNQNYEAQPHQLHILAQIVNQNETFLKKSAEKALENLNKKYCTETNNINK